jgi:hypothetical protein
MILPSSERPRVALAGVTESAASMLAETAAPGPGFLQAGAGILAYELPLNVGGNRPII